MINFEKPKNNLKSIPKYQKQLLNFNKTEQMNPWEDLYIGPMSIQSSNKRQFNMTSNNFTK